MARRMTVTVLAPASALSRALPRAGRARRMAGYGRAMLVSSSEKGTLVLHSTFKPLAARTLISVLLFY